MSTPAGRFHIIAILEGISYLVLLGIAMPLKYLAGKPEMVKYVGWAHGVLFVMYMLALAHVWMADRWSFKKAVIAFIASLVPFGPFIFERQARKERS